MEVRGLAWERAAGRGEKDVRARSVHCVPRSPVNRSRDLGNTRTQMRQAPLVPSGCGSGAWWAASAPPAGSQGLSAFAHRADPAHRAGLSLLPPAHVRGSFLPRHVSPLLSGSSPPPRRTVWGSFTASAHRASSAAPPRRRDPGREGAAGKVCCHRGESHAVGGRGVRAARALNVLLQKRKFCRGAAERGTGPRGGPGHRRLRSCAEGLRNCPRGGGNYRGT